MVLEDQHGRLVSCKLDCKRTAQAPPRLASDTICTEELVCQFCARFTALPHLPQGFDGGVRRRNDAVVAKTAGRLGLEV